MTETRKHKAIKSKTPAPQKKTKSITTEAPLEAIVEAVDANHIHLNVSELHPNKIEWPLSALSRNVKVGDKLQLTLSTQTPQAQTLQDLRKLLEELVN
jgi:hypothetical protein